MQVRHFVTGAVVTVVTLVNIAMPEPIVLDLFGAGLVSIGLSVIVQAGLGL